MAKHSNDEEGMDAPIALVRRGIGTGGDKLTPKVGVSDDEARQKRISKRRREFFQKRYLPKLQAFRHDSLRDDILLHFESGPFA